MYPDVKRTFIVGRPPESRAASSRPLMPGRITSVNNRCTGLRRAADNDNASAPLLAAKTS